MSMPMVFDKTLERRGSASAASARSHVDSSAIAPPMLTAADRISRRERVEEILFVICIIADCP
jgi:hypothetical protein